ncbi:MAG: hypothetical protein NTY88_14655, partial [Bacteroidetes bacterium]|nr:hypothetical protein [Bacteroidota bacterium]
MKKVILVILVFGLSAFQVNAQGNTSVVHSKENIEECNYLIHYRDTTLLKVWDKTVNDYKIPKEAIVNLDKLKKELDDDTWYGTTNFHTLTLTLKLASNAIRDMIKIVAPLQSIAYTVTGTWVDKAQMVAKIL